MARIHFTADTHFGHPGVIGMCDRPFGSIEEHDACLVQAWNASVQPGDTVYHLGDFDFRAHAKYARGIFDRLNGTKHLIVGNHDYKGDTLKFPWASKHGLLEIEVDGQALILCHYAMRTWRNQRRGAVQLFGHSHGKMPGSRQCIDAGVDVMNYRPVTWPEIKARLALLPVLVFRDDTDAVAQLERPDPTDVTGYTR